MNGYHFAPECGSLLPYLSQQRPAFVRLARSKASVAGLRVSFEVIPELVESYALGEVLPTRRRTICDFFSTVAEGYDSVLKAIPAGAASRRHRGDYSQTEGNRGDSSKH